MKSEKISRRGFTSGYLFTWQDRIKVVGDKRAQWTVKYYAQNKAKLVNAQAKLRAIFQGCVKTIAVIRDPFNTILHISQVTASPLVPRAFGTVKNQTLLKIPGDFTWSMKSYMDWIVSVDEIMKNDLFDVKLIHLDEMFKNPEPTVREWCQWLNIECFPEYVNLIKDTTKTSGNSNKYEYFWPKEAIMEINDFVRSYSHLYVNSGKQFMIDPDYFNNVVVLPNNSNAPGL